MIGIEKVKIVDPGGRYDGQILDVFIKNGKIAAIDKKLDLDVPFLKAPNLHMSIGWLDVGTYAGEPGYEHRETQTSLSEAAASGGFTGVIVRPDVDPIIDTKTQVDYMQRQGTLPYVDMYVLASIRSGQNEKLFSEMYDLNAAGAKAFVDLDGRPFDAGFTLRALQYLKGFDGLMVFDPSTYSLNKNGQINEGVISTEMGLPGMPALEEHMAIYQVIQLAKYSNTRLHIQNVSTKSGVEIIKAAKKEGMHLTASVAAMHLVLDETDLLGFDVNTKVKPPLRTSTHKKALINGLKSGAIDFVDAHHQSIELEAKKVEFPYASFGVASIENTFSLLNEALGSKVDLSRLIEWLGVNNRQIFGISRPRIEEGAIAKLTLFDPNTQWIFESEQVKSKGKNNPFVGRKMKGKVYGVINGAHSFYDF